MNQKPVLFIGKYVWGFVDTFLNVPSNSVLSKLQIHEECNERVSPFTHNPSNYTTTKPPHGCLRKNLGGIFCSCLCLIVAIDYAGHLPNKRILSNKFVSKVIEKMFYSANSCLADF